SEGADQPVRAQARRGRGRHQGDLDGEALLRAHVALRRRHLHPAARRLRLHEGERRGPGVRGHPTHLHRRRRRRGDAPPPRQGARLLIPSGLVSGARAPVGIRRMSTIRALLVLCVGALLLAAHPTRAAGFLPGDHLRALPFGGLVRTYRVHVPPSYDGSVPVPLVLDIHGFGSNAEQQEAISGMRAESDAHGFLVVYPQGTNDAWNAGTCCGNSTIDDVGFLRALVASISTEANTDGRRVYATGLSNGGAMTQRLACDAADLFAAAAPMSFPIPLRPLSACQPVRSMPVLTVMGLTDVLVVYSGGPFGSGPSRVAHSRA